MWAKHFKTDWGIEWLAEYVEGHKKDAEILESDERQMIEVYREMRPEVREMAVELMRRLRSGEILNTGHYSAKKPGKKSSKKGRK